ncbi:acetyl-CoA C-acetyltransferase [Variovorax guangxiensis]|uniref:acetyl-CoA C-acetyltransferase n=1 Tax=Variovorax guangxiensis TaxID=1775474 RepID=UPI00286D4CDC|nr:acetyl-CoA C-acetyltransferase [Variovorax guangxiensis]
MRRAAIVSPLRTAVGTFGASLRSVSAADLGAAVVNAILERTGLDPTKIEEVVFAQSYASSESPCVGRWIALHAGLPVEVAGMHLDRRCGGGLQAITTAAMMVQTGVADVVIAGGVESMSNIEYYTNDMRWGTRAGSVHLYDRLERGRERSQPEARFGYISGMIETAENLAKEYNISREEADEYAVRSQLRAASAWDSGKFNDEVVSVKVPQKNEDPRVFSKDEGIRPDATVESLSKLRPIITGGTVTAGNSSQQNDAAAACLVVAEDKLKELKLEPLGYLLGWATAGCHPAMMGIGPVPATQKVMSKTGLLLDQMDLVELNEAFACQVLAVIQAWGWNDPDRINVNGSGISLGHPIAATGVRIVATLLNELRRRKGRYALETMCIGGGQGIAAVFERA